jgi:methionyl aminopeptidase
MDILKKMGSDLLQMFKEIKKEIKVGKNSLNVANKIEKICKEKGYNPAFPCNISVNSIAAHDSPMRDYIFTEKDMVKIDFGIEKDGFIVDAAFTVDLSENNYDYLEVCLKCLEIAKENIDKDIFTYQKSLYNFVKTTKFNIIENLCSHSIERYKLHALTIPNVPYEDYKGLKFPELVAIEPFICDGKGFIDEGKWGGILKLVKPKIKIFERKYYEIKSKYPVKYISPRWEQNWELLYNYGFFEKVPKLIERTSNYVAQFETTFYKGEVLVDIWKLF